MSDDDDSDLDGCIERHYYDEEQEIARCSYADMLHDTERNEKYYKAIKLAIDKMHSLGKKAKVLDIGTGSGLLSMMAVKCGADYVIACEAFEPIAMYAMKVLKANGVADKIKVIPKHSNNLIVGEDGDLHEKVNILVAELFDTELIGDGALIDFSSAHDYLLEKDSIVIPSTAVMYAQVVESETVLNWNRFRDIRDTNGELLIKVPNRITNCIGSTAVHDIQLSQLPLDSFKQICVPQVVFRFDWSGKTPLPMNESKTLEIVAETSGKAQAVFMWWELGMDLDNTIILSCAPYWAHPLKASNPGLTNMDIPWRDHWLQAIYYLPKEITVNFKQKISLRSYHDMYSVWFNASADMHGLEMYEKPLCSCDAHMIHSPSKIGLFNDLARRKTYISLLKKHVRRHSVILFIGNNLYLGLVAAKLGAKKLLFLDDDFHSLQNLRHFIDCNNIRNFKILPNVELLETDPDTKNITLIFGEPHFTDSTISWENVKFANIVNQVKRYARQNIRVIPKECVIKGLLVEFINLQKTRFPVGFCGEFNMKHFDDPVQKAIANTDPVINSFALWEYPCLAKSSPQILAQLNMFNIYSSPVTSFQNMLLCESANKNFNAIVFWSEWHLDGTGENIISTGPIVPPVIDQYIQWDKHSQQGVRFVNFNGMDGFDFRCHFENANCELIIEFP